MGLDQVAEKEMKKRSLVFLALYLCPYALLWVDGLHDRTLEILIFFSIQAFGVAVYLGVMAKEKKAKSVVQRLLVAMLLRLVSAGVYVAWVFVGMLHNPGVFVAEFSLLYIYYMILELFLFLSFVKASDKTSSPSHPPTLPS